MAARPWESRVGDANSKADPDEVLGHSGHSTDAESSKIVEVDFVKQNSTPNGHLKSNGSLKQRDRGGLISQSGRVPNDIFGNGGPGPQREPTLPNSGPILMRESSNSASFYSNGNSHYSNGSTNGHSRHGNANGNGNGHTIYDAPTTPNTKSTSGMSVKDMPPMSPLTPPVSSHESLQPHPVRSASPRRAPKRDDEEVSTASTTGRSAPSINHRFGTRYTMGPSVATSIRDDESLASSPSLPSYMQATQSARAKVRSHSTPKSRPGTPEKDLTPAKKRLSFPTCELPFNTSGTKSQKPTYYSVRSPTLKGLPGPKNVDRFTISQKIRDRESHRDDFMGDLQLLANGMVGDLRQRPFR
jgi:hypothetical protein